MGRGVGGLSGLRSASPGSLDDVWVMGWGAEGSSGAGGEAGRAGWGWAGERCMVGATPGTGLWGPWGALLRIKVGAGGQLYGALDA